MKTFLVILFAVAMSGCNSLDRLLNGADVPRVPDPEVISSNPLPENPPEFNREIPDGTRRVVHYGVMPLSGVIHVPSVAGETLDVFILVRSIPQWFVIGDQVSEAYWYERDSGNGTVTYRGGSLSFKAYCVYQYVPEVES